MSEPDFLPESDECVGGARCRVEGGDDGGTWDQLGATDLTGTCVRSVVAVGVLCVSLDVFVTEG